MSFFKKAKQAMSHGPKQQSSDSKSNTDATPASESCGGICSNKEPGGGTANRLGTTYHDEDNLVADSCNPIGGTYSQSGDPYYYQGGDSYDPSGYPPMSGNQMQREPKDDPFESRGRRRQSVTFRGPRTSDTQQNTSSGNNREERESSGSGNRGGDDSFRSRCRGRDVASY